MSLLLAESTAVSLKGQLHSSNYRLRSGTLPSSWAGAWLRLAFDRQRDGDERGAKRLFAALVEALQESQEATKARSFALQ